MRWTLCGPTDRREATSFALHGYYAAARSSRIAQCYVGGELVPNKPWTFRLERYGWNESVGMQGGKSGKLYDSSRDSWREIKLLRDAAQTVCVVICVDIGRPLRGRPSTPKATSL